MSQSDLFALVRLTDATVACTIEGKVEETFGPTVEEWFVSPWPGKEARLAFLCDTLGLKRPLPDGIRYQLLHRTVSAILEARRFKTDAAAMIVHSFSPTQSWRDDFEAFLDLLGTEFHPGGLSRIELPTGMPLRLGWACGDPQYLLATRAGDDDRPGGLAADLGRRGV